MSNFASARANMVEGAIRPTHVTDPALLEALHSVPRELFVPAEAAGFAYIDETVDLGNGRRCPHPLLLGRLIQVAQVTRRDTVLDVGCATGYSTALLSRVARTVVALESDAGLAEHATRTLAATGSDAQVVVGPLAGGHPARAPYDVILISGTVAEVPETLLQQLTDGGRLVAVVGVGNDIVQLGQAQLYRRIGNTFPSVPLFEMSAPVLPGFERKPRFVF